MTKAKQIMMALLLFLSALGALADILRGVGLVEPRSPLIEIRPQLDLDCEGYSVKTMEQNND